MSNNNIPIELEVELENNNQQIETDLSSSILYVFSPTAKVELLQNGNYLITITDKNDTTTAQIPIEGGAFDLSDRIIRGEGNKAIVEGDINLNVASGSYSHAQGYQVTASGGQSHAQGSYTTASDSSAHAEGINTLASYAATHAEGHYTKAANASAHAEGWYTEANGAYSHAEGKNCITNGSSSHAQGDHTEARGEASHTDGIKIISNAKAMHSFGMWNDPGQAPQYNYSKGTYIETVGNGSSENARSNARTLDWNGNEKLAGSLTLGAGTADEVTVTAAQLKQLLELL